MHNNNLKDAQQKSKVYTTKNLKYIQHKSKVYTHKKSKDILTYSALPVRSESAGERRSRTPPKPPSFAGRHCILVRLTLRRCRSPLHIFGCAQQIGGDELMLGEGEALGEG